MLLLETEKMSLLKKLLVPNDCKKQKLCMRHQKTKEKGKKDNYPQISEFKIEEESKVSSQGSDNTWFSSWSSMTFDSPKSKKRAFSNDDKEEDKWWSSFCSK